MKFIETALAGAYVVEIEPRTDERGFFARTVCEQEFAAQGLNGRFVQQSVSWNPLRGTLRGLHFQAEPYAEVKLVRVTRGSVFDVIVDLRKSSPTFAQSFSLVLTAHRRNGLYVPKGFAHGFQTLEPDCEVLYEMTEQFIPEAARGIRWDDRELAINWPLPVETSNRSQISLADLSHLGMAAAFGT